MQNLDDIEKSRFMGFGGELMKKTETITVRDLLPIKAVQCQLSGTLVPFYRSCKGEGKRSGKPCEFYIPTYMCRYLCNLGIGVDSHEIKR